MKRNNLRLLGFLGLVGLLGIPTGNAGFYGFFGLFAFFSLGGVRDDELLRATVARAGLDAFVASFVGLALSIAVLSVVRTLTAAAICLAVVFALQVLVFVVSFSVRERSGAV